jgi:hypothetical protein
VPAGASVRTKPTFLNERYLLPCGTVVSLPNTSPQQSGASASSAEQTDVLFSIQIPAGSVATLPGAGGSAQKVVVPPGVTLQAPAAEQPPSPPPSSDAQTAPPLDVSPGVPFTVEDFPVELCVPGNTTLTMDSVRDSNANRSRHSYISTLIQAGRRRV